MNLFYRTGGYLMFAWKPVLASAAELPAKRLGLFSMGYPTILVPEGAPAPTAYAPAGAWAGKGIPLVSPAAAEALGIAAT